MIAIAIGFVVLLCLICLAFGIRTRQPRAIVASFLILATLYCWYGYLMAAMLTGNQLAAEFWLTAGALSLMLAGFLAFTAWRRSSGSR
jgi:hypothetical protein